MKVNKALILIDSHIRRYYRAPIRTKVVMDEHESFNYYLHKYNNWAATEIRSFIDKHRDWEPINTVEEFRYMMDTFACNAKNEKDSYMFGVAYEVATDILDILIIGE